MVTPAVGFRVAITAAAGGLLAAAFLGAPLVYDGAYQLVVTLQSQVANVDKGRYLQAVPELPALLASQYTSDMGVIRFVFSLSSVTVPLIALVASWLIVRKDAPHLFVWAALGIFLVCLPGNMYFSADSMRVAQLGWPVLLATMVRLRGWTLVVAAGFSVVLLLYHPFAAVVLLCSAGLALVLAKTGAGNRRRLLLWATVAVLFAAGRIALVRVGYETSLAAPSASVPALLSLRGRYLVAYAGAWIVGLAVLAPHVRILPARVRKLAPWVAAAALALVALAMLQWASQARLWAGSDNYHDFALGLELPLVAFMAVDALVRRDNRGERPDPSLRMRAAVVPAAAIIFGVVLSVQSLSWAMLADSVARQVQATPGPCIDPASIGPHGTAVDRWATPSVAIAMQGRTVTKVLLTEPDCQTLASTGAFKLSFFDTRQVRHGWFRFSSALTGQDAATSP